MPRFGSVRAKGCSGRDEGVRSAQVSKSSAGITGIRYRTSQKSYGSQKPEMSAVAHHAVFSCIGRMRKSPGEIIKLTVIHFIL